VSAHSTEPAAFRPIRRTPLSVLVSRQIRDAIVSGELLLGSQLPTEQELTEQFDVSRSTVREAVRILQAQGLLSGGDTVSTSRPRVSGELTNATAGAALENALRLGSVPLPDLVELRLLLEGAAVTAADPGRLGDARDALAVMEAAGTDVVAFHAADVRFHISLTGAGGNSAFPLVMGALRDAIAGHLSGALEALADPQPTLVQLAAEHATILAALDAGDGELARQLVHAHIWGFYSRDVADAGA
jgi:GntR family transcriptional repressor for pyruvate dehydrogenase complex